MFKNPNKLSEKCLLDLKKRGYSKMYTDRLKSHWTKLAKWMKEQSLSSFDEEVGRQYCLHAFNMFLIQPRTSQKTRVGLRAIRMLISFQKGEEYEFRTPRVERRLEGELGELAKDFLTYRSKVLGRKDSTLQGQKWHLWLFCNYMEGRKKTANTLGEDDLESFLEDPRTQSTDLFSCMSTVRQFLLFLCDKGLCKKSLGALAAMERPKRQLKVPTTYSPEEITQILQAVETNSAIGKRDLVILLLASAYGLRASDICSLTFTNIDWDAHTIALRQNKTGEPVKLPLSRRSATPLRTILRKEGPAATPT